MADENYATMNAVFFMMISQVIVNAAWHIILSISGDPVQMHVSG